MVASPEAQRRTPSEDELDRASATRLAQWLRAGALSSRELTEHVIAAVERWNPLLNAVVYERFEAARAEAKAADAVLARGEGGPLAGVPCTIKEFFAVAGAPQTGGLVARSRHLAGEDSPIVARLRAAGAIVVGTTNVPEGGIWLETYNALYGRTHNPWDLARTPGGSSGGEGAIVGAGASPFGLGSDIGGSVRLPAAFCGVVGHKPSGRLLPNSGQFPAPTGEALAMLCPGPIVRRVEDVMPLLRVMAGPDPGDPVCEAMALGDPAQIDLAGLEVWLAPTNARSIASATLQAAARDAGKALERRGARVRPFDVTRLARGAEIWASTLAELAEESYDVLLAEGKAEARVNLGLELARTIVGRGTHTLPALVVAALGTLLTKVGGDASRRFVEEGRRLREALRAELSGRGVLLHPPYTRTAPRHDGAWLGPLHPAYTALFNVLETPSTVVPVGRDRDGMPAAVQVIGAPGDDARTIAAAAAIEAEYGGWHPPPLPARREGRA